METDRGGEHDANGEPVTYAFASVAGFGWLLLAMGCNLCKPNQHLLRAAYVATWFTVPFYSEIPWASPLVQWMS